MLQVTPTGRPKGESDILLLSRINYAEITLTEICHFIHVLICNAYSALQKYPPPFSFTN